MEEGSRYVRGMFSWMGFRQIGVPYARAPRYAGETKYPLRKMLSLAMDGVVGFSRVPLRMALNAGLAAAALAVLGGLAALLLRLLGVYVVPGWASVIFVVCFLGGVQLAVLGVMGEYIGRTYEEVIRRPLYIVDALHGVVETGPSRQRAVVAAPQMAGVPDEADFVPAFGEVGA